ncbi:hypothetical protein KP509_29G067400 [Ceratopteris richardii]|uniref:Uncharacterized protein n=1 Tax=Ceratopteris richardii TaxID=49495 RepID=A0A8T2R7P3_CERRI|nr:hypothetical protein KP509_29G067400 [Ceratopteris richardii]
MKIGQETSQYISSTEGIQAQKFSNVSLSGLPIVAETPYVSSREHDMPNIDINIEDLCTEYSAYKFKSTVNWLDRLRAAQGFTLSSPDLEVEKTLPLPITLPEVMKSYCHDGDGSACAKQKSAVKLDAEQPTSNNSGHKRCVASRSFPCGTSACDIRRPSLCKKNDAKIDFQRSRTLGEHPLPALRLQDFSDKNDVVGTKASTEVDSRMPSSSSAYVVGHTTDEPEAGKRSRNGIVQVQLSEDVNVQSALPDLYFNMFAELFCLDSRKLTSSQGGKIQKQKRKQERPKICSVYADLDPKSVAAQQCKRSGYDTPPVLVIDSGNPASQLEVAAGVKPDISLCSTEVGAETVMNRSMTVYLKKKSKLELDATPKTDLFIIDTSLPGWRTEKFISRKGKGWKIRSKRDFSCSHGITSKFILKNTKKPMKVALSSSSSNECTKLKEQLDSDDISKKKHNVRQITEPADLVDYVAQIWNNASHTHVRSSRKRKKTTLAAESLGAIGQ